MKYLLIALLLAGCSHHVKPQSLCPAGQKAVLVGIGYDAQGNHLVAYGCEKK